LIIPVRWFTNRSRMQEFGERCPGKKYFSVLQPDWSIAVGESQPFSSFRKSLFFSWLSMAKRTKRNGSKNEGEGLQAHPGRQKVGQACGWQEVEENCKDVSREETTEARDQPERRKPTHTRSVVSG
jgi:hypothetical protein